MGAIRLTRYRKADSPDEILEAWIGELTDVDDLHVGMKRVARLMRAAGLAGVSRRKFCVTTTRDEKAHPAPDLVNRSFSRRSTRRTRSP